MNKTVYLKRDSAKSSEGKASFSEIIKRIHLILCVVGSDCFSSLVPFLNGLLIESEIDTFLFIRLWVINWLCTGYVYVIRQNILHLYTCTGLYVIWL